MPYDRHPHFHLPENADQRIWRYLSLSKFVDILISRSLYFSSIERLSLADPFEGRLGLQNYVGRQALANLPATEETVVAVRPFGIDSLDTLRQLQRLARLRRAMDHTFRKVTYANCWYIADFESDAMWKLYSLRNEGIAIVSTVDRFCRCFHMATQGITIGRVEYIDHQIARLDEGNALTPYIRKNRSFVHENELRAVFFDFSETEMGRFDANGNRLPPDAAGMQGLVEKATAPPGKSVWVDLEVLVDEIFVSPLAESWFADLVSTTARRLGLEVRLRHSSLYRRPPLMDAW